MARELAHGFQVAHAAYTDQRPVDAARDLAIRYSEQVHPRRRKMIRIIRQRLLVDDMPLAVEPPDRPMVPARGAPVQAARVAVRVFLDARQLRVEAGNGAEDAE